MERPKLASERQTPVNDVYVEFWLYVIKSGVECKDYEYFMSDTFEEHCNLIPDRYFESFLGVPSEEITVDMLREIIFKRMAK